MSFPEPLFEDSAVETITFASDFVQTSDTNGILYAYVNDSFVRAYELSKKGIIARLPG